MSMGSFQKYIRSKLPVFDPPTPLFVPVRFLFVRSPSKEFCDAYDAYFE